MPTLNRIGLDYGTIKWPVP
ncbi:hypothetical protein Zm00014a_005029 [Zea mays]|uniref:Uncharacterized protein n=1 Tax=Zea mays TaxID=4577 RepID=A0A3L6DV86_MAIZE|nr:hypothetical protein Zm00014a_005029 [Zea mays]